VRGYTYPKKRKPRPENHRRNRKAGRKKKEDARTLRGLTKPASMILANQPDRKEER